MNDSAAIAAFLPTEDNHFKGRYALWLGLSFLLLGGLTTLVSLQAILMNGRINGAIIIGVITTIIGILYLIRPYFSLAPNRLTVYNLLGNAVKRCPFESFGHLIIEKGTLYIENSNESREKVKINRWMVKSADWKKLKQIASSAIMPGL